MKSILPLFQLFLFLCTPPLLLSQALRIPDTVNISNSVGRKLGVTQIEVNYNAPAVRGREGAIWGSDVVPYDFTVLGFGSDSPSPWRAGADESTTISFSTDVQINGRELAAGTYGFFVAVYPDSCQLIFNKNTSGWGSYFYNRDLDVLRVTTRQEKEVSPAKERLEYRFYEQTPTSVTLALEWEKWRIPFTISINAEKTILAEIQKQLSGALGFDPPSLLAGARWCLRHNVNQEQALGWINSVVSPGLGGQNNFTALSIKAGLLDQMGKHGEAQKTMALAEESATILELHQYGRELLIQNKTAEAFAVFERNYKNYKGAWPTHVGMMRGYSALKNFPKALQFAKKALAQAPDPQNKKALEGMIGQLEEGKDIN